MKTWLPRYRHPAFNDAVAAPVLVDDGIVGTLVVAHRFGDNVTFEGANEELLEALAEATRRWRCGAVSSSIGSARRWRRRTIRHCTTR